MNIGIYILALSNHVMVTPLATFGARESSYVINKVEAKDVETGIQSANI